MFSRVNTVKQDIIDTLYGGASRTARELAFLMSLPERSVREALAGLMEKGILNRSSRAIGEKGKSAFAYSISDGLISVVGDLCASPVVLHVCRLYSGTTVPVVYEAPDRCDKDLFLSEIARNISAYAEKNFPGCRLAAVSFLHDGSSPLPRIAQPGTDTKDAKIFFWSRDELAAIISSKEVKSELTLYVDLSGERLRAFIFRPGRRYEVPMDEAPPDDDPEKSIIRKVSALYRAFHPDVVYISAPFGGSRLESGIRNAIDEELQGRASFSSELFSHSLEKKLISEAAKLAAALL